MIRLNQILVADWELTCWNGDPDTPNAISRLRYHELFLPKIVERIRKTAPPGADLTSWVY